MHRTDRQDSKGSLANVPAGAGEEALDAAPPPPDRLSGTVLAPQDRTVGEFVARAVAERVTAATMEVGDPAFHVAVAEAHTELAVASAEAALLPPFDPVAYVTHRWAIARVCELEVEAARAWRSILRWREEVRETERAAASLSAPATLAQRLLGVLAICALGAVSVAAVANLLPETIDQYALRAYFTDVYGVKEGTLAAASRATAIAWALAAAVVAVPNVAVLVSRGRLPAAVKGAIVGCEVAFSAGITLLRITGEVSPQAVAFTVLEFAILALDSMAVFALAGWLERQGEAAEKRQTTLQVAAGARRGLEEAGAACAVARQALLDEQHSVAIAERRHVTNEADRRLWGKTAFVAYLIATQKLAIAACGTSADGQVSLPQLDRPAPRIAPDAEEDAHVP